MQGDDVGAPQKLLETYQLDVQAPCRRRIQVGIAGYDRHAEGLGPDGDSLTDPPESDDPQRLALELGALELLPLPLPGPERGMR